MACLEMTVAGRGRVRSGDSVNLVESRQWRDVVDLSVKPIADGTAWELADLLGRSMGNIRQAAVNEFTIHPEGHALTMGFSVEKGPG
jgi:hypothetical protein